MLGSLYTALSGLNAYSKGLDVISNNVANLNTPGFKTSDPLFREIVYRNLQSSGARGFSSRPAGVGVSADSASMSFKQGDLRDTGNPLDAGIDGNGFFVLSQDGEYRYTRAGQFEFNDDGILVDRSTGAQVVVSTDTVAQGFFDLNTARIFPPRATTEVTVTGTLARGGSATPFELPNITVVDSAGTNIALRARFTRNGTDPLSWDVQVLNQGGTQIGGGSLRFNANGTPAADASRIKVTVPSTTAAAFVVTLDFGAADSFAGVTSPATSSTSQLQVLRQDGLQVGSLTRTDFDEEGQIRLSYSNGETKVVGSLLLAQFDAPEQLRALGAGMFIASESANPTFGRALSGGLGRIMGGRVETSNVDLSQQFTDLIIMQRGYQASSQISSIANELIQTLLAMDGRR